MGSIVIIIDKSINPDYQTLIYNDKTKRGVNNGVDSNEKPYYDLTDYINLNSGTSDLLQTTYNQYTVANQSSLIISPDVNKCSVCIRTNTKDTLNYNIILPDDASKDIKNPIIDTYIMNFACQIIPYKFYSNDENLKDYENMFNKKNTAFMPISKCIEYIKKKKNIK